ncbi:Cytochrome P450 2F2 [Mycena venus]|uniref:Cytochrome P450 2F2 n=1 Tax=Mycena venus TaxID=2733690 RepID=A0A8H6Y532_9AGAR|nr:Cytochrome P450 2F2 [Mycena venus]
MHSILLPLPLKDSIVNTFPTLIGLSFLLVTFIVSLIPCLFRKNIVSSRGISIPPGPILRYAFLRKHPEKTLHNWARAYGSLFSLWMGNQLFVVVSDAKAARDLLVTQGAIFSSRKKYFVKDQTIFAGRGITSSAYDDTWRHHRRLAMLFLTPKAIEGYGHVIEYEAFVLVRSLYADSQQGNLAVDPASYADRYAVNNMLSVSFATRSDSSSGLVKRALEIGKDFMDLTGPFSNAIDFLEPLQWIATRTRSRGRKVHDDLIRFYGGLYSALKARMEGGEIVPDCLAKTLIETEEKEKLDWEDTCMLTGAFILGGGPISEIIQWTIALLPSYPDIQARAHEELDRVIGRDHWPSAEDENRLPYIRAFIKEVERVHNPFWMATPHYSTQDHEYNGMFIPKDTVVVLNCFTMHHDEERYPDPYTFNPERYLGDELTSAESAKLGDPMKRDHWSFGAGRRICPGLVVAELRALPSEPITLRDSEGLSDRTPLSFRVKFEPRHEGVHEALGKLRI